MVLKLKLWKNKKSRKYNLQISRTHFTQRKSKKKNITQKLDVVNKKQKKWLK